MEGARRIHLQSATESLSTYAIALIIVAVAIVFLYFYFNSQTSTIVPSTCEFPQGYLECQSITLSTNSMGTTAVLLISNGQQYALEDANIIVNSTTIGSLQGHCTPNVVLPGGYMECIIKTSNTLNINQVENGELSLQSYVCAGQQGTCNSPQTQVYSGIFTADVENSLATPLCTLTLTAKNKTNKDPAQDLIKAVVKFNGDPIAGATVNFTSNSTNVALSPGLANTNSNGSATSYASSLITANAVIVASFATCSASNTISFQGSGKYHLTLVSNPAGAGTLTGAGTYSSGTTHSFSETPSHFYSFVSWNGVGTNAYNGVSATGSVTIESAVTETATFNSLLTTCHNTQSINGNSGTYNVLLDSNTLSVQGNSDFVNANATNDLCYDTVISLNGNNDYTNVTNGIGIQASLNGNNDDINFINSTMSGRNLNGNSDNIYNAIFVGNYMDIQGQNNFFSFYLANSTGTEIQLNGNNDEVKANTLTTGVLTFDINGNNNNFYINANALGGSANIIISGNNDNMYLCDVYIIYNSISGSGDNTYNSC